MRWSIPALGGGARLRAKPEQELSALSRADGPRDTLSQPVGHQLRASCSLHSGPGSCPCPNRPSAKGAEPRTGPQSPSRAASRPGSQRGFSYHTPRSSSLQTQTPLTAPLSPAPSLQNPPLGPPSSPQAEPRTLCSSPPVLWQPLPPPYLQVKKKSTSFSPHSHIHLDFTPPSAAFLPLFHTRPRAALAPLTPQPQDPSPSTPTSPHRPPGLGAPHLPRLAPQGSSHRGPQISPKPCRPPLP